MILSVNYCGNIFKEVTSASSILQNRKHHRAISQIKLPTYQTIFSHFYSFCVGKIHSEQKVPIILPHTAQDVTTFQNLRCSTFIFHGFMVFILFLRYRMFVLFLSPNVIYMKNKKGQTCFCFR